MNAKEYLETFGIDQARGVAEKAGTNYVYFSQLAHGHRRPSVELAQRLVEASGGVLDFTKLLTAPRRAAA